MSCGHAVAPENLLNYYWQEIKSGRIEVRCPSLPDENNRDCKAEWEFKEVLRHARLSADERFLFLSVLFTNWLEKNKNAYICPRCDETVIASCPDRGYFDCYYCQRKGDRYSFCTRCSQPVIPLFGCKNSDCEQGLRQLKSLLHTCHLITIVNVPGCPKVRACPKCHYIIKFDNNNLCKHMTCFNGTCETRFCFICLSTPSQSGYWPCGGAYDECPPAPRQKIV
ncbi:E3 ubiquitin-protein ligase RNF19B-like [Pecten maximus]|uniref:E3 ubiquitin-protein ligase RNF19B-like n=1 Tax=Pecten maximus TaxID=6579 RepID=UPI0014588CBA|nr:E3 ubiquitin-protein ligase RNF19B-like [Pecten maximus]